MLYVVNIFLILLAILIISYYCFLSANPWTSDMDKAKILSYIPEPFNLEFTIITPNTDLNSLRYPLIFKPIICNGNGKGVSKINSAEQAREYMNKSKDNRIIAQELYDSKYEAGVLYERNPLNKKGKIKSIVLKEITGSEWKPQRCSNSGQASSNCYNLPISQEINDSIDYISSKIPDFYAGRYDIRFSDMKQFFAGKDFKVLEVNGAMGFDLNTSIMSLSSMKDTLRNLLPWIGRRIAIGFKNICRLRGGNVLQTFNMTRKYKMWCECEDYEHIFQPSSA